MENNINNIKDNFAVPADANSATPSVISAYMASIARKGHATTKARYGREHYVKMAQISAIVRKNKKATV